MLAVGLSGKESRENGGKYNGLDLILTTEEMNQCEEDWSSQNYKKAPDENEGRYKNKYTIKNSAASTLSWIDDTYL